VKPISHGRGFLSLFGLHTGYNRGSLSLPKTHSVQGQGIYVLNILLNSLRRQDSSIGFGAPVRANMRGNRLVNAAITSSLLEMVNISAFFL